jgi:hypothetical protein
LTKARATADVSPTPTDRQRPCRLLLGGERIRAATDGARSEECALAGRNQRPPVAAPSGKTSACCCAVAHVCNGSLRRTRRRHATLEEWVFPRTAVRPRLLAVVQTLQRCEVSSHSRRAPSRASREPSGKRTD